MDYSVIVNAVDKAEASLARLADKIWENPETAFNETCACRLTAEALEGFGFKVEAGYAGMPTAIKATWGHGHPVIGILGEYDALPGLSQKISSVKEPVCEGAAGHGCGHNLLGVASLAAVVGMKAELEASGLEGTVVYYGCPGEEQLTGKPFMARNGAFRDLDMAFSWHGGSTNFVSGGTMTGLNSAVFHFRGRTAHAGGDPYNGRSALDAAELTSVGAQYLREHVTSDVRIHYSYKEAGTAPNIVPDRAAVWYYVRALSREAVEDTYNRLVKVAEGAARMTETELEVEFLGGCYNTMTVQTMLDVCHEAMNGIELPQWTDEEQAFAKALNENSPLYESFRSSGALEKTQICNEVLPIQYSDGYASTDVGDVMHIVPTLQINTACWNLAAPGHSWQVTACSGMSIGHKGMLYGGKVMAATAAMFYHDKELVKKAQDEWVKAMNGRTYKCPIPAEVPLPMPANQ